MRKLVVLFLLFASTLTGFSQTGRNLLLFGRDTTFLSARFMLEAYGDGGYRSNALNNELMGKFLFGGYIDEELKDEVSEDLRTTNRAGFEANAGIRFYNFSDSLFREQRWGLLLQMENRIEGQFIFRDELFQTLMYGNADQAGTTAIYDQSSGNFWHYQKMGVGVFHKKSFSGLTLSFVNGQEYFNADVSTAQLYTSGTGDSLAISLNADIQRSDTSRTRLGSGNGAGACLDFHWNLPLLNGKGLLLIAVEDLGFIQWTKRSISDSYNDTYSFTGVELADLIDTDNSLEFPSPSDSLNKVSETGAFNTWLPTRVRLGLVHQFGKGSYYEFAIRTKFQQDYVPEAYGALHYFVTDRIMLSTFAAYGGYGGFRIGAGVEWMPKGTWYIQLRTNDLPGAVSPALLGRQAELRVAKFFGS